MKSGKDPEQLQKDFESWQARRSAQVLAADSPYVSPIEHLQNMVPASATQRQSSFDCDPALVDHEGCDEEWEQCLQEAPEAMRKFNSQLRNAIMREEQDGKTSVRRVELTSANLLSCSGGRRRPYARTARGQKAPQTV